MPPQQPYRLLDLIDEILSFRAHLSHPIRFIVPHLTPRNSNRNLYLAISRRGSACNTGTPKFRNKGGQQALTTQEQTRSAKSNK